jgi:hypothetical protein
MAEQTNTIGKLERGIERRVMDALFGLTHPQFEQLVWRRSPQSPDEVNWADRYHRDRSASANPRTWQTLAMVAVPTAVMLDLWLEHHDVVPAVAYLSKSSRVVVGALPERVWDGSATDGREFNNYKDLGESHFAHAFRVGPGDGIYTIGFQKPDGSLLTPAPGNVSAPWAPIRANRFGPDHGYPGVYIS